MKTSLRLVRIISQQDCQFYDSLEYSQKTAMCKAKSAFHHYPISTYLEKDIVLIRERLRKDKSSVTILHVWNVTSNHIQKKNRAIHRFMALAREYRWEYVGNIRDRYGHGSATGATVQVDSIFWTVAQPQTISLIAVETFCGHDMPGTIRLFFLQHPHIRP